MALRPIGRRQRGGYLLGLKTRFSRKPTIASQSWVFCLTQDPPGSVTELERLKNRLLRELLASAPTPDLYAPLRRASNEAAALAWGTSFPLLVLPELLREKAEEARSYTRKQAALLKCKTTDMGQAA